MSPTLRRTLSLVAAASLLAVSPAGAPTASGRGRFVDLRKFPKPKITGKQIVAGLENFVERFPMRQNGLPNNDAAAHFLARETKKLGYKTRIVKFKAGLPEEKVDVVEAIKRGTQKPNEWIAFVAHYDIVEQSYQGAYDDGSGTNMLRYFAKAFAKVKTKRSIVMLWFDGEEDGLLASEAYTKMLKKKGQKVHAALGFDMVGIGYPAPYCICIWHGPNPADLKGRTITDYVNFDFLKFPKGNGGDRWPLGGTAAGSRGHVCNCGVNTRNSDEQNFAKRGYFTMRWAGMKTAAYYPGYHQPWDTVPFIELVAGSRKKFEKGSENTFRSAYYTALVLDNL